jgi:hypothetical protein
MATSITDEQWPPIDEAIFANLKLPAIRQIQAVNGCSLREALDVLYERYEKLQTEAPEQFNCNDQDYWVNSYS